MATDFLTADDLEREFGTPASTWRYWVGLGTGPRSFKIGRRRVWKRADVELWVEQQRGDLPAERPELIRRVLDCAEALLTKDYAAASRAIPVTGEHGLALEAVGVIVRMIRESDRPTELLDALRRECGVGHATAY